MDHTALILLQLRSPRSVAPLRGACSVSSHPAGAFPARACSLRLVPAGRARFLAARSLRQRGRSPPGGSREPLPARPLTSPCLPSSRSFLDLRSQDVNWANDFPFVLAKGPSVGVRTNRLSFLTMRFCCGEYLFTNPWKFIFRRWESYALVCALGLVRVTLDSEPEQGRR